MNIVITMGGRGSRFRASGFDVPKYMIKARSKTLFEWSMLSLSSFQDSANYIFIALKDEKMDAQSFIEEKCATLGIKKAKIILIDKVTDGQATTVLFAKKYWKKDAPLLVYNIDTYIEQGELSPKKIKGDAFIPCFRAKGEHWSFVRLGEGGKAKEVAEKKRISEYCSIGAYYFSSCALYENLYNEYYTGAIAEGEKYIAPMYNALISRGGEVYIQDIDAKKVHVLGTPEELCAFESYYEGS